MSRTRSASSLCRMAAVPRVDSTLASAVANAPAPTMPTDWSDSVDARRARPTLASLRGDVTGPQLTPPASDCQSRHSAGASSWLHFLGRGEGASVAVDVGAAERFRVIRPIGEGGMGVVYEAEDCQRGQLVALKTLKHRDLDTLYRLKREFRALAHLSHPNLVDLYDMVVESDT